MSQRFGSPWIAGAHLFGDAGFGLLAENIPSTGDNGPSYLYNDISLPTDAGKEVCGRITTWPSAGQLFAYEDGSFEFVGAPDGAYSFGYQLYVDGVPTGAPVTADLYVGSTPITVVCARGQAEATGHLASLHLNTVIQAGVGSGAATGHESALTQPFTLLANMASAGAVGYQAQFATEGVVAAWLGVAASNGVQATIRLDSVIGCATGVAQGSGLISDIALAGNYQLSCGLGQASAMGRSATFTAPGSLSLTQADIDAIAAAVVAALNGTTIPVDAVTGAWPTAIENADAVWSKQLP